MSPRHRHPHDPSIKIYHVDKGSQGGLAVLDFFVKAESQNGIKQIEYRAKVDGKQTGWKKYPYCDGITNHLYFKVDYDVFTLWVHSIDKTGKKSKNRVEKLPRAVTRRVTSPSRVEGARVFFPMENQVTRV